MNKQLIFSALFILLTVQSCSFFQNNWQAPAAEIAKHAAPTTEPAVFSTPALTVPQSPEHPIAEAKAESSAKAAPAECLTVTRNLITYLSGSGPDISENEEAQKRWLSGSLIKALRHRKERVREYAEANPGDKIEPPNNASFIGAWDYPTSYKIVGSRYYGRQAIVDILYMWGKNTQYEGQERLMSYIFEPLDGQCRLEDIYTHETLYSSPESLREIFSHPSYP